MEGNIILKNDPTLFLRYLERKKIRDVIVKEVFCISSLIEYLSKETNSKIEYYGEIVIYDRFEELKELSNRLSTSVKSSFSADKDTQLQLDLELQDVVFLVDYERNFRTSLDSYFYPLLMKLFKVGFPLFREEIKKWSSDGTTLSTEVFLDLLSILGYESVYMIILENLILGLKEKLKSVSDFHQFVCRPIWSRYQLFYKSECKEDLFFYDTYSSEYYLLIQKLIEITQAKHFYFVYSDITSLRIIFRDKEIRKLLLEVKSMKVKSLIDWKKKI